ncbi:hypothetical protein SEVIR_2G177400v4 [Setaria viridis]|uniref:AP2/ERF domain-containing protein n=1 Tax=Setaria viridis TaxID=4556 RepID=A0A4U6VRW5_SETVI|nr:ethylene-responsive transcription factor ERF118-like [Setaria viridis]XP_034583037.1 ethylene-responsive transcription factor ERF118-like [Setaria viridis]XP_034583038.1 ethylene-responsive transcription factor ERF118-like [Setaria viridis]XP_034583039.1 ethylene-responsive transcription factor ERF118-like [Setaria viridis]XP_034583040.1 ethylene-responsive transcription factor ERF118-like [Setaria viridis]XP_034583041.1 ethylene-responsive transcription factor ERF118-like [Setaria viridis]
MLRSRKMPPMRKVRIFCSDPDATDSSGDENDENPKKEKKIIREVLVPVKKYKTSQPLRPIMPCGIKDLNGPERKVPSSRYRGVRLRDSGRWQAEIRNPLTKKREYSLHDTEEEAAAAYQAKWNQFHVEMLAMKAEPPMSEHAASNSSLVSCVSSSVSCEQKAQEAQNRVGPLMEMHREPMDESLLNFSPKALEISEDVMLNPKDEHQASDSDSPADEFPPDGFTRQDMFTVRDFITATYKPLDDDYIGLADISHLPLPIKDPEFDLDAELDWSGFDFASMEHELELL